MFYNLLLFPLLLYLLNLILVKFVFLIDKPSESFHKIEKKNNIPLSGGLFIFFCLILLSLINLQFYVEPKILFFLILILILGIFSDIRSNFSPKVRIIFQLFIIIFFVMINEEILINKTNIEILDLLLNSKIGKYLFTIFCIITLLNGFNFMDGVNGFVSGYILSILVILNLISLKVTGNYYFNDLIYLFFIFFIFNIFGKSFLGDNGVYISSILLSYLVINLINLNTLISPIVAVSLLWYPAIENLFTIVRRLSKKKMTYLPDKLHLHSLIYRRLSINFIKYKNSFSGILINILLLPNFIFSYLFYDNSLYLGIVVIIYITIYLISYSLLIKRFDDNKGKFSK